MQMKQSGGGVKIMAPLRRLEHRHPPPEGGALSTELQGRRRRDFTIAPERSFRREGDRMRARKMLLVMCAVLLVLSVLLTSCSGGGNSTSTPGTGEEHSLPSPQAGYPADGGIPTPESGYPQPE